MFAAYMYSSDHEIRVHHQQNTALETQRCSQPKTDEMCFKAMFHCCKLEESRTDAGVVYSILRFEVDIRVGTRMGPTPPSEYSRESQISDSQTKKQGTAGSRTNKGHKPEPREVNDRGHPSIDQNTRAREARPTIHVVIDQSGHGITEQPMEPTDRTTNSDRSRHGHIRRMYPSEIGSLVYYSPLKVNYNTAH
ncbi:hypothetical protein CLF_108408 [Clonorchis sinensis]|uniref:Uncharacterized protein n=1 Tax=Clonorchis sinensis TaxID=79923 RepID=G7YRL5_CLOSI|nr:hypothetical protein CLF_108408 [Clonorchis sinensis]